MTTVGHPLNVSLQLEEKETPEITEGYDEYFDPPLTNLYECPICLLILRYAVQTECGHRFCKGCIIKTLNEGRKVCPVDNQPLTEEEIYPDNFARREIITANVRCRNEKQGCTWTGKLMDIEMHMKGCPYDIVQCENDCGEQIYRYQLPDHMQNQCPRRVVTCPYCSMAVIVEKSDEHNTRCSKFPVMCPNFCSSNAIERENLQDHLNNVCPKVIIPCPYSPLGCQFQDTRERMDQHLKEMYLRHTTDLVKVVGGVAKAAEKKNRVFEELQGSNGEHLVVQMIKMEEQIAILDEKIRKLEESDNQAHILIDNCSLHQRQNFEKVQEDVVSLSKKIDTHDTLIKEVQAKLWCGRFIWKINNFEGLFQEAKSGGIPAIHSLPFYSAIPGYKMCIRVNLNGVDTGASTHVSVFIHMMQGEFDAILAWPFLGKITLTVIDQSEGEKDHITENLVAKPGLQAFVRPRNIRNHKGYGYVQMISHDILRNGNYVKNDIMMIEVKVEP